MLAKAQAHRTGERAHSPTCVFCVILNSFMSVLLIHETQKSHSGERGTVVRQVGFRVKNDVTVWDPGLGPARSTSLISPVSDPNRCGRLPSSELKLSDRAESTSVPKPAASCRSTTHNERSVLLCVRFL